MITIEKFLRLGGRVAVGCALIAALLWAGREDFTDAVVVEMQNNGAYERLSDAHPEASASELAVIYLEEREAR